MGIKIRSQLWQVLLCCFAPYPAHALGDNFIGQTVAALAVLLVLLIGIVAGLQALVSLVFTPRPRAGARLIWLVAACALLGVGAWLLKLVERLALPSPEPNYSLNQHPFGLVLHSLPTDEQPDMTTQMGMSSADTSQHGKFYLQADKMPRFPGGDSAALHVVRRMLRYPALARQYDVNGLLFVSFIVEANGKVRNAYIIQGLAYGCDEEALRVVKALPAFRPGQQNGKPVPVCLTWVFSFRPPNTPSAKD